MSLSLPMEGSIIIPVVFESPLTTKRYPERGEVLATLDTGYTGFTLVPEDVYRRLGLDRLEPVRSRATTADGRVIELVGNYALVRTPEIGLMEEGLVETASGVAEILLGVEWLKGARLTLDGCSEAAVVETCR